MTWLCALDLIVTVMLVFCSLSDVDGRHCHAMDFVFLLA
jgi:hypothetical protein